MYLMYLCSSCIYVPHTFMFLIYLFPKISMLLIYLCCSYIYVPHTSMCLINLCSSCIYVPHISMFLIHLLSSYIYETHISMLFIYLYRDASSTVLYFYNNRKLNTKDDKVKRLENIFFLQFYFFYIKFSEYFLYNIWQFDYLYDRMLRTLTFSIFKNLL